MRTVSLLVVLSMTIVTGLFAQQQTPGTHLKVGDMAPDFTLRATTGDNFTLSAFRGQKTVVIGFFPAAFTGGCTKEANAYRVDVEKFAGANSQIIMISTNMFPTLQHWAAELGIAFPMASDFMRTVTKEYGVLNEERGVANRTTFVVDKAGKIQHIEVGNDATDVGSELEACTRLAH